MPKPSLKQAAATLARRLDRLARVSDERGATTRTFMSPAMRRANALVGAWMRGAGLSVRVDPTGNLVGRTRAPRKGAARYTRMFIVSRRKRRECPAVGLVHGRAAQPGGREGWRS